MPQQRYDVIGDVHGCIHELAALLAELGFENGVHREGRQVVFLGDLVDRGPDSPAVLKVAMRMVHLGSAIAVRGNHEEKLIRALSGRSIQYSHGLEVTMRQLEGESATFRKRARAFCESLPHHLVLDDGRLVVAHAGLAEHLHGVDSGRARSFALYGDTTGGVDDYGLPVRLPWQNDYRGEAMVLYGHTPMLSASWVNNTMCLDTACVFGGALSALRYPELELVQVAAQQEWYPPSRPLA
jgi:protein phosphatase